VTDLRTILTKPEYADLVAAWGPAVPILFKMGRDLAERTSKGLLSDGARHESAILDLRRAATDEEWEAWRRHAHQASTARVTADADARSELVRRFWDGVFAAAVLALKAICGG